jgi:DNA polymerase-1
MDAAVVLAVDGNSLVHRSFHANGATGQPAWAVRGLLSQLVAAVDRIRPTAVVVGFDDPDRSVRRERWPSYKANRGEKLATLVEQLAQAVEAMRGLGVAVAVPDGWEADDVLASTAAHARRLGASTVVVTSDRDAFALIDPDTRVLRIINGGVDASPVMNDERLVTLLGIRAGQYRDFAALRGDPSDNLPGVRGIGRHHAARLLATFPSAAVAFDDLAAVRSKLGPGVADRLAHPDARPAWEHNCQVMAMRDDLPIDLELTAGPGVLPLRADAVEAVYRSFKLTWSVSEAMQVLADHAPDRPPREVVHPPLESWTGPTRPRTPAAPKVKRRKPVEQLALF